MTFKLTRRAAEDLIEISHTGANDLGESAACAYHDRLKNAFEMLAQFPRLARAREELTPPVRIHPFGAHLIIYDVQEDGGTLVLRIRHTGEDWIDD